MDGFQVNLQHPNLLVVIVATWRSTKAKVVKSTTEGVVR